MSRETDSPARHSILQQACNAMPTKKALPNDLILMVMENLDIDSFLSLRLTCRKYHEVIASHILSLAQAVARSTFPSQTRIFEANPLPQDLSPRSILRWLKWLRYEQLAAIIAEQHGSHSLAAEDTLGDTVRSTAANGWHVIAHLGSIAKQVSSGAKRDQMAKYSSSKRPFTHLIISPTNVENTTQRVSLKTCSEWLLYMESRTLAELQGYKYVMDSLLYKSFDFQGTGQYDTFRGSEWDCAAWLMTRIIELGPQTFWNVFWTGVRTMPGIEGKDDAGALTTYLEHVWTTSNEPVQSWHIDGVRVIERQREIVLRNVHSIMNSSFPNEQLRPGILSGRSNRRWNYHFEFDQPAWERKLKTEMGEPAPAMQFVDVPFKQHVDWKLLGYDLEKGNRHSWSGNRPKSRRERREVVCRTSRSPPRPRVSRAFEDLLRTWEEEWLESCDLEDY